jgi:integrase
MPSAWIERRQTASGLRYRIRFRLGGAESVPRYGGSFGTRREALSRLRWVEGELAACRLPDPGAALRESAGRRVPTVGEAAEAWRASRLDVAGSTGVAHQVALARLTPELAATPMDELQVPDVATWVAALAKQGLARSSIYKSLAALRMALDHAGLEPNPARDRRVKLPREVRPEVAPPTAAHVEAALAAVAPRYRLPLLVLEATAMRVGELEALVWGDVDEDAGRWRVHRTTAKTSRSRWVQVPADLFAAVLARVPREDRRSDARVFPGAEQARMRTALGRACAATGTPRFGLHDLRHRRLSVWHRDGVPAAEAARRAGHARPSITLDVYSHVLVDDREVDWAALLWGPS